MKFTNQKIWIIGSILVVAVAVMVTTFVMARHAPAYNTATIARRDITQTVRANGTVSADQSSTLSFSTQGKIQAVLVHEGDAVHMGDTLAYLDMGTVRAQLDGAKADLAAAQATLTKLQNGTRPEELALYKQKYTDASQALIVAINNAYLQTTDAILNKSDQLFTNGNTVNPVIKIRTQSENEQLSINNERINIKSLFDAWKQELASTLNSTSSLQTALSMTNTDIVTTQTFLNHLSTIVGNLSTGNSGMTQSMIDADTALVNAAQQEVTGAANTFTTASAAWSSARDTLTLQDAGAQSEDIAAQSALVAKAQAQVEAFQSALSQSVIRAPFDGTITTVNMKVGEVVVPGISADENIGIINTTVFNIDTYVPENAIGAMRVGNPAQITFDAYGPNAIFPAHVYIVSPSETIQNGVSSYKVTLRFDTPDDRIRSGLTVNAVITTATATNAIAVPTRAIITKNDKTYVLLKQADDTYVEHQIVTGIVGSRGYTEVISGLNQGDVVANFGTDAY